MKSPFAEEVPALRESQVAVINYSGSFIRERRGLAQGWMKAYIKEIRYKNRCGMKFREVAPILAKYTHVLSKVIADSIPFYLDDDGKMLASGLKRRQDWFFKMDFVKKEVPMNNVLDESFLGGK